MTNWDMDRTPLDLSRAVTYDIETFPNVFTLHAETLHGDTQRTWEISEYKDERQDLLTWFYRLSANRVPMIGFNSVGFDYPVIHFLYNNPTTSVAQIYAKAQSIITSNDKFLNMVWASERFAPQIDLFKIHHFDNRAKTTSLKALQINMRSPSVVESAVPFGTTLTREQIDTILIPYNRHDVHETKRFAHYSAKAMDFRNGLVPQFGPDVLNYNDTKIGAKILESRLGEDVCYHRPNGHKKPRQTPRSSVALADIIFPYVRFDHPEFQRILDYMRAQVLTRDELAEVDAPVQTKGVFSDLKAAVGGIEFWFGTGGIHGSVTSRAIAARPDMLIRDIDVEGLYPSIAIVNRLAPEHLGAAFIAQYASLPIERKKYAKGTVENASFKLAANGTYGNSNNKFSVFYDPKFTMAITINGQLLLCMLAERLVTVPTLQLIQINTDGITYTVRPDFEPLAAAHCMDWMALTRLKLEDADYSHMWIRDVNSYVARSTDGKLKRKGAYWTPDEGDNYATSISEASPPAWHKDLSAPIITRAAVAAMVEGIDPDHYIRSHTDPFDFMCRAKVDRASKLMLGDEQIQGTSRYYVAINGAPLRKITPPVGPVGTYKRRNGLTDAEYLSIARTLAPDQWDERIHTKNRSRHEMRELGIKAGWKCAECNDADRFLWSNLNYDYYISEARKLIIAAP